MKITLILAASPNDPLLKTDPFMPMALPLLAALTPEHDYTLIDMLWDEKVDFDKPTDLVGISVRLTGESMAYQIAAEFRKKSVPVVLGGPQISSVPHRAIKFADAVTIGEAEQLWPQIVHDAAQKTLKNFYICSPKPFTAPGYSVYQVFAYPELDKIPVARRNLMKRSYAFDTVFSTRGCPVQCDFCSVPQIFGTQFRHRPIHDVVAEIATFKRYYYLLDDSVFGKPSTYDYYLDLYKRISSLKKIRYWTGQANLDAAATEKGRQVIRSASKAGLLYAAIGMESINPVTLRKSGSLMKQGADEHDVLERMKEHIRFIQDQGIIISGWFVIGYDDDTVDTYYKTLQFCNEMQIIPAIFPVKALPETPLYKRIEQEGKLDETKRINYRNPAITDSEVSKALDFIFREGYSLRQIISRTRFYLHRFKSDKIHNAIFTFILQQKIKKGIDVSNEDFFVETA